MNENETNADKFEYNAHGEQFGNWMILLSTAVNLDRHKEDVYNEKYQTLLENILLVV